MSKRIDVSTVQNLFHDAQKVDQSDLLTEQNHNNQNDAAIINNHFGSGVLLSQPQQIVIFDSDKLGSVSAALVASGNFDGTGISPTLQPSDINLGNQLEIELTGSNVFGRLSIKIAIIGLSFDGTIQSDRFYFYRNEKQVSSKHYKKILAIFFSDFKGNTNCSRNNGGRVVIKETASFQLSKDPIMVSQDLEPDLFWRDYKLANIGASLFDVIQTGIGPAYSVQGLNINTTGLPNQELLSNDVTAQVGQKFKATTNNIQKITLLLGIVKDATQTIDHEFDWSGDMIVSIYPLQTSTVCPTDIVPELAIDFDPANVPLAQLSVNQSSLRDFGYVLSDVLQPVDFVFNATKIGSVANSEIIPGNFYAITIKRSGAANTGTISIGIGNNRTDDARVTLFSSVWVDIPEQDLWFQIWTDAAKIADGQGYDAGNGVLISKTTTDSVTGSIIDNQSRYYSLSDTGENILNTGIIQALENDTITVQDERNGNQVFSRKQFVPSFSFVNEAALTSLKNVSEPLIVGGIQDTNPKQNPSLTKTQNIPGLVKDDTFCIINPDADLLSLNLLGSKLTPNSSNSNNAYRIFRTTLCTDGYGDVNGDGYIDATDIAIASGLIGESIHSNTSQQKIVNGLFTTLQLLRADVDGDGYVTTNDVDLITNYVNRVINAFPAGSSFTHLCLQVQQTIGRFDGYFDCGSSYIRLDGYNGLNIVSSSSLTPSDLIYDGYISEVIMNADSAFNAVPFANLTYTITPQPFWQPYLLAVSNAVRLMPASFTFPDSVIQASGEIPLHFKCEDHNEVIPSADPGRNDFFVPDNLYIGKGQLLRPDGSYYPIDFEYGLIILELPQIPFTESAINVFDKFVADRGDGFTRAGYPSMKYADKTLVQDADLSLNRVRFGVSLQSFVPNLDGYSEDGYGVIVDDIIGIQMDQNTGILKLSIKDLSVDPVYLTLVSKIQIQVMLKKAGWVNQVLIVGPNEINGLIS